MRIGFEAKRAFCNNTGLGNYCRSFLSDLERLRPENQLLLFTPEKRIKFATESEIIMPHNKLLSSFWRSYGISKNIEQYKLDLYHGLSHELPINMHQKVKTVVTMHDLIYIDRPKEFKLWDRFTYDRKFRYACKNAHSIVAITNETKNAIIKHFQTDEKKIHTIYQSCHQAFMQTYEHNELEEFKRQNQLPKDFILFVGSLNPRKKPFQLVQAFHQLLNKIDHHLILIGRGQEKERILQYIKEHRLENRIYFTDFTSKKEMAMLYQLADLFAFPSVHEGFGIPIVEAQFSKTAVITSPYSCLPEVAGEHSFFQDPDQSEQFAQKILEILTTPELKQRSIEKSYQWVQRYRPEKIIDDYMNLYEQTLRS